MYKSMITTTVALVLFAVTGGTVYAGQDAGDHKERRDRVHGITGGPGLPGMISERMALRLELDDVQTQSVRNVLDAARPEFEALRERGRALRVSIQALDPGDPTYGALLQNLSAESGQVAAEMVLLTGRIRTDIHVILTPEQQQSLADMLERLDGRHGRGRQAR